MSIDKLVERLDNCKEVKPRRGHQQSWIARCPAHDDTKPSLYVDLAQNGNILIKCWTGCGANDVIESVGMHPVELFPEDGYQQRSHIEIKKDSDWREIHLSIAKTRREQGKTQTAKEKEEELQSYLALRGSV